MLIIPAEHPLDWKKPPVMTLLLILLNVLVYLLYQGGDEQREQQAVQTYLDGGLLSRERELFIDAFVSRHDLDADEQRYIERMAGTALTRLVLYDLQFEHDLHQRTDYQADPQWQAARQRAEAARDKVSSIRFGFIPARFTVEGLVGAMFLHGSIDHLVGNMLFLFIFGFALEIALGRWLYLGLYLATGIASHLLWWLLDPVWISGVGASGAVSGLMGMYIGLYGLRRINFFYWLGPFFGYLRAPALWILPVWLGKELYGLLWAKDNVNYYAHLGGLAAGYLGIWLPQVLGRLKVNQAYLDKEQPDAAFTRELASLDQVLERFDLEAAAARGLDLLSRYPGRLALLQRLYPLALNRRDKALLSPVLQQLLRLPESADSLPLLQRLARDSAEPQHRVLQHPSVQAHLLQRLLRAGQGQQAIACWRHLCAAQKAPDNLPVLTLMLAKQVGNQGDKATLAELASLLHSRYPDSEQTRQLEQLRAHLAR